MYRKFTQTAAITLGLIMILTAPAANALNMLEIGFERHAGMPVSLYDVYFVANKDGATTCKLVIDATTYTCSKDGDEFIPEQSFWVDYTDLPWGQLSSAISVDWVLTWDEGMITETVATIQFGPVIEGFFMPLPSIEPPYNGSPIINPSPNPPTISWSYDPIYPTSCDAQLDVVMVYLMGPAGLMYESGELGCGLLSWTPPAALIAGEWTVKVQNVLTGFRKTADGIGGSITGDPWVLENEDWLALISRDNTQTDLVPTERTTFGRLKALYRE